MHHTKITAFIAQKQSFLTLFVIILGTDYAIMFAENLIAEG